MHCQTSLPTPDVQWYALRTRSRQEKAAAARLSSVGISNYLPLKSELRQWSDRKQRFKSRSFQDMYLCIWMSGSAQAGSPKDPGGGWVCRKRVRASADSRKTD